MHRLFSLEVERVVEFDGELVSVDRRWIGGVHVSVRTCSCGWRCSLLSVTRWLRSVVVSVYLGVVCFGCSAFPVVTSLSYGRIE